MSLSVYDNDSSESWGGGLYLSFGNSIVRDKNRSRTNLTTGIFAKENLTTINWISRQREKLFSPVGIGGKYTTYTSFTRKKLIRDLGSGVLAAEFLLVFSIWLYGV